MAHAELSMKDHHLLLSSLAAATLSTGSASAALIASESFDYPVSAGVDGLVAANGGSGFSGAWKTLGGSNVQDGIFAGNVSVTSTIAPTEAGNHAQVKLSTVGTGIGRNLTATVGADNTTAWLSFRMQNNNVSAA